MGASATCLTKINNLVRFDPVCGVHEVGYLTWPEMTDIINILIRCKFAYHVEFGFICEY